MISAAECDCCCLVADMLISFPSEPYNMHIEMTDERTGGIDDGAALFFHMCSVRAAAGERAAVRYEILTRFL